MKTPPKDTLTERPFSTGFGNYVGNLGSRIAQSTMAAMGSSSAAGRLSAANASSNIYREWQRYAAPKRLAPNLLNVLGFFQTTYGENGKSLAVDAMPGLERAFPSFLKGIAQKAKSLGSQIGTGSVSSSTAATQPVAADNTTSPPTPAATAQSTAAPGAAPSSPATAAPSPATAAGSAPAPGKGSQPLGKATDPALNRFFSAQANELTPETGRSQKDIARLLASGQKEKVDMVPRLVQKLVQQAKEEGGMGMSSAKQFLTAQAKVAAKFPDVASFLAKAATALPSQSPAQPPNPNLAAYQNKTMSQIMAKVRATDPANKAEVYPLVKELVQHATDQGGPDQQRVMQFLQQMRKMTESLAEHRLIDLTLYLVEHEAHSAAVLNEGFKRVYGQFRLNEADSNSNPQLSPKQLGWLFKDLGDTFIKSGIIRFNGETGQGRVHNTNSDQLANQPSSAQPSGTTGQRAAQAGQPAAGTVSADNVLKKMTAARVDPSGLTAFLNSRRIPPAQVALISKAAGQAASMGAMLKALEPSNLPQATVGAIYAYGFQTAQSA